MFKQPVLMRSDEHASLRFTPANNFSFAASLTHVPVLAGEVIELSKIYPIVFAADSGLPIALLGVNQGENLYLDENNVWHAPAVPASCKNYPFALTGVPVEADGNGKGEEFRYAVVMDAAADTIQEKEGKLLFNKNGEGYRLSPFMKQMQDQLADYEKVSLLSRQFFKTLLEQEVLVKAQATFKVAGIEKKLEGFARVDWDKVQNVPADVLGQWQESGMMDVLTAHSSSMQLIQNLVDAAERRAELKAKAS